jgi:16S rRNA processing protein RimM
MNMSRLIPVGKITRTHGLRGAVKVFPYGETLDELEPGGKLYLYSASNPKPSELTLVHSRCQGKFRILQFEELPEVEAAQRVVEQEVFLSEECLPATSEGEYYHYQLIGLRVETTGGEHVGILSGIIETGSNDVYVVGRFNREVLIPATAEVILEVDLQEGRMVIEPPEGLLDDL